jgi:hypothetical protein
MWPAICDHTSTGVRCDAVCGSDGNGDLTGLAAGEPEPVTAARL